MNDIISTSLLVGDNFMPEMHLIQPRLIHSACGPFTYSKERKQKFKVTVKWRYISQNKLDKAYFLHNIAHGDFQDSPRRIASDKVLRDKALNITKNPNYNENNRGLALMAYRCFGKKSTIRTGAGANCNPEDSDKKNLSQQLHKPIIRKLVKRKVYSSFNDNIWGADVTDMPLYFDY